MLKLKIILLLFSMCIFCTIWGQTTRKAYPDTFRQSGNVLLNDFDPQGDPLKCVKFNSLAIKDSIKITKKDTGIFILKKDGSFKAIPLDKFNGRVKFTYEMTDGKGGASSKGTILFIKEVEYACTRFMVDCSTNDSCKYGRPKFWVKVNLTGQDYYAYAFSDSLTFVARGISAERLPCKRFPTYYLRMYAEGRQEIFAIDQTVYNFITQNSCPE